MTAPATRPACRSGRAPVGEGRVELAYDLFGEGGEPMILVMGIGAQRIFWHPDLCARLVEAGFHVARFDHRDVGESSRLAAPPPPPGRALLRRAVGLTVAAPYTLSDMAGDVVGLMDALGWPSAHVVGVSLGGMIVQHLALEHPRRVATATSIMSSPGNRRFLPAPRALGALFGPAPRTAAEAGEAAVRTFSVLGSPAWPPDPDRLREVGAAAFARGTSPKGFLRHFAAALASGGRLRRLGDVRVPMLVIHGTRDPMFPLAAGRAVAAAVPGATWLPIAGMGHDLPEAVWPALVGAIARHARRGGGRAPVAR